MVTYDRLHTPNRVYISFPSLYREGRLDERLEKNVTTHLFNPMFPVGKQIIPPFWTGYSTMPHHEKWHQVCDGIDYNRTIVRCTVRRGRVLLLTDSLPDGFQVRIIYWHVVHISGRSGSIFRIPSMTTEGQSTKKTNVCNDRSATLSPLVSGHDCTIASRLE